MIEIPPVKLVPDYGAGTREAEVVKHGSHDQSSHGNHRAAPVTDILRDYDVPSRYKKTYERFLTHGILEAYVAQNDRGGGCDDISAAIERDFGIPQQSGTFVTRSGRKEPHMWNQDSSGWIFDAAQYVFPEGEGDGFGIHVYPPNAKQFQSDDVYKHGTHDQSSHGRRSGAAATSSASTASLADRVQSQGGFTYDIKHGRHIKSGNMVSDAGTEVAIDSKKFFNDRETAVSIVKDYIRTHRDNLLASKAYFGAWHDTDSGRVVFDVSRRYSTKRKAWQALEDNNQDAFYDLKTGTTHFRAENPYVRKASETFVGDSRESDGRTTGPTGAKFSGQSVFKQSVEDYNPLFDETLTAHVSNGRSLGIQAGETVVAKHGNHDQSSHGRRGAGHFGGHSVKSARDGAQGYCKQHGIKRDDTIDYEKVVANRERAAAIADAYDTLPNYDRNAEPAFRQLATEVDQQFDYMTKTLGIQVEFIDDDPYPDSKSMFAEATTGKLRVLRTASTGSHPFFTNDQNDKFRAVHDFFGHAATGRGFGQDGEEAAWVHHSQMFTALARQAMTTETRGQNSWFNTRKNGFAEQKVALLPEQYWQVPASFVKSASVVVELVRYI